MVFLACGAGAFSADVRGFQLPPYCLRQQGPTLGSSAGETPVPQSRFHPSRFAFRRCVRHKMEKELAHGGKIWYSLSVMHSCAQRKNWKDVRGSIALHSGEARSSGCRRCKAAGKGGCISQAKGQSHRLVRTRAPPGMRRARQRKMNAPEFCRQSLWWVLSAFLFCVRGGNLPCWNGSRRSTMQ